MQVFKKMVATVCALAFTTLGASAEDFTSPEILIIGDSQISFGSGPAFLEFFSDIKDHCHPNARQKKHLERLGEMRVGVIGVRSSSIDSWTARSERAKDTICKVDPKWNVNAGAYGFVNKTGNKYVQIGKGKEYQFCAAKTSPLEEMLRDGYYDPKLILMSFLGNSAKRWANNPEAAVRDVERLQAQLPPDLPCIFMTTAPAYKKKIVDLRLRAQKNLMDAFKVTGLRCTFVPGATPETVAANQGNKHYFRLNRNGMVKDPYHPNEAAAKNFFALEMDQICSAIFDQIEPTREQS
ncbi:SGNH/GDSL hydrolase family protein [Ruegeria sp. HKCCA5491]|uniref:SGNH/GDSL hydrolase family protein n=1 Tax=Ruegeria sp. HKCCA5491 TaxID=2682986 RepID=UPI0014883C5B|nr:SGNH/GDSL hydrolase family protein [Ruegeria sp. HKCCA5491]